VQKNLFSYLEKSLQNKEKIFLIREPKSAEELRKNLLHWLKEKNLSKNSGGNLEENQAKTSTKNWEKIFAENFIKIPASFIEPMSLDEINKQFKTVSFYNFQQKPEFDALILTSANASFALNFLGLDSQIKIFAVGEKTAAKCLEQGFRNVYTPKKPDAENLCELIKTHFNPSSVEKKLQEKIPVFLNSLPKLLYLRAKKVSFDFQKELSSFAKLVEIVVYQQFPNPNFDKELRRETLLAYGYNELQFQSPGSKNLKFLAKILIFSQISLERFAEAVSKEGLANQIGKAEILCPSQKLANLATELGFCGIFLEFFE